MIQRRRLLWAAGGAVLGGGGLLGGCATPSAPSHAAPASEAGGVGVDLPWLSRVTWGVDSAAVQQLHRQGRRDYLLEQLHPPARPTLPAAVQAQIDALSVSQRPMSEQVEDLERRRREADGLTDDEAKKAAQQAYQQAMNQVSREAATQMMLRALYSPSQLQEQLTWFWFNHFNVHQYKSNLRALVADYESQLRSRALGRFSDLLIASATHPAMIRYLDNEQNALNHINENYAREVMELHTLGVDGGYSQKDVQELARVLTGLGVNLTDKTPALKPGQAGLYVRHGLTEFNPARHDMGDKLVLGQHVSARGWEEIIEQLNRLARHPSTARHVSRKLAVYFAADQPPPAMVDRMTHAYLASDGQIAVTLQALFDAPEFAPTLSRKFKDPMHYVVSSLRVAYDGKQILNAAPALAWLNRLGEGLYNHQTPDGFAMDEASWSGSGQMSTRFEVAKAIGSGSAGLFKTDAPVPKEQAAFPQLSNSLFHGGLSATLSDATRAALDAASTPQEWNVLLLSSPEFMFR